LDEDFEDDSYKLSKDILKDPEIQALSTDYPRSIANRQMKED
jgi:hypothetical protein